MSVLGVLKGFQGRSLNFSGDSGGPMGIPGTFYSHSGSVQGVPTGFRGFISILGVLKGFRSVPGDFKELQRRGKN